MPSIYRERFTFIMCNCLIWFVLSITGNQFRWPLSNGIWWIFFLIFVSCLNSAAIGFGILYNSIEILFILRSFRRVAVIYQFYCHLIVVVITILYRQTDVQLSQLKSFYCKSWMTGKSLKSVPLTKQFEEFDWRCNYMHFFHCWNGPFFFVALSLKF